MRSCSRLALLVCAAVAAASPLSAGNPPSGGWLNAGLRGAYFANPDLAGTPAFSRKDPRIDFEWGAFLAPGGSRGRGFNAVGTDHYSARWTGRLLTRFTEPFAFIVDADDGVRLSLRAEGSTEWITLIDAWDAVGRAEHTAAPAALVAGVVYEVRLDYRELSGAAAVRLLWESANTPRAVIDPAAEVTLNWNTYDEVTFADAIRNGRSQWEGVAVDTAGWPQGDGTFIVSEILQPFDASPLETGRMRLSFRGQATVTAGGNGFVVPGSVAYDATTNTTTAWIQGGDYNGNVLSLTLTNTRRTPASATADGVTEVSLMRPVAPGSSEALPADELIHPATRAAFAERLTGLRFQRVNDQSRLWSERTQPWWPYQGTGTGRTFVYAARYGTSDFGRSMLSHEFEIMLCNETGTDYMVSIPHLATTEGADSYVRRLARLIRHGSDASGEPYAGPVANPYHPPLNPNLRVHLEIGNELWNFLNRGVYSCFWDHREFVEDLADAYVANPASPDGQRFAILNFDNLPLTQGPDGYTLNNYTWVRRHWGDLLRRISDAFRIEFSDTQMPGTSAQPRIRPYYGYQYANANDTARMPLEFLDARFNNAAGNFTATPRPVSYYIHGAGGAGYFGSGNPTGATSGLIPNPSFESPVVAAAVANPAGATWSFSGDAGIVANAQRSSPLESYSAGALRNDASGWFGLRFNSGPNPGWVYELGRLVHPGNSRVHGLVLVRADTGALVTYSANVPTSGVAPGTFAYAACTPVRLQPNTSYVLLSAEENGFDAFGDVPASAVVFSPASGLVPEGAVTATQTSSTTWTVPTVVAPAPAAFGPLNLRIAPDSAFGNPDSRDGTQVAWIGRDAVTGTNGAVEVSFTAPAGAAATATYGLTFRAVQRSRTIATQPDQQFLRIFAGDQEITYTGINGQPAAFNPVFPWQRISFWIGDYYFTEAFTLASGATITLRFEGAATAGDPRCFLDDIRVTSVDAIFAGGIPDTGEATGQPNGGDYAQSLRVDARWAHAYGLHHMTYEHGWSIGGDSGASPVQEHAKFRDPRAAEAMLRALDIFHRAGGANLTLGTYSTWPLFSEGIREEGTLNPSTYPLVQGLETMLNRLPAQPDNGVPVPAALTPTNAALAFGTSEPRVDPGEWIAWNILVDERADHRITLVTASFGAPPQHRLTLNEQPVLLSGAPGGSQTAVVNLPPGLHTLKWRGLAGILGLASLTVTRDGAPASAPTFTSVADDDGRINLAWSAVDGATSYVLRHGSQPGFPEATLIVPATASPGVALTGLPNGFARYITVAARNASGAGLPSTEVGATPFADGQDAVLASWDFAGQPGAATTAQPTLASARVQPGDLTRGPAFVGAGWAPTGCFLGTANPWAQTLAGAATAGHWVEFTVTPRHGRQLSVDRLEFRPAFQNVNDANPADPRGTGISWRIGNGVFSPPMQISGPRSGSFNFGVLFTAQLGTVAELQNVAVPVTVRIYFHGMAPFEGGSLGGPGADLALIGSLATPALTTWRALHNLPQDGSQDLVDHAGDGLPALARFAFNLAPAAGDLTVPTRRLWEPGTLAGLPRLDLTEATPAQLRYRILRRSAASFPGAQVILERSTDLVHWSPPASVPEITPLTDGWELVTHTEPPDTVFLCTRVVVP